MSSAWRRFEGFKRITAHFDGIVTARERSGTGPELFKVFTMRVYVQVPQQMTGRIKEGLTAELDLPQYPDKTFKDVGRHQHDGAHPARGTPCRQPG
jgi:hypothetical protein